MTERAIYEEAYRNAKLPLIPRNVSAITEHLIGNTKGKLVFFDGGAGNGPFSIRAARIAKRLGRKLKVISVEPSRMGIEKIRERAREEGLTSRLETVHGTIQQQLSHVPREIHFVNLSGVLHHLPEDKALETLGKLGETTAPGGVHHLMLQTNVMGYMPSNMETIGQLLTIMAEGPRKRDNQEKLRRIWRAMNRADTATAVKAMSSVGLFVAANGDNFAEFLARADSKGMDAKTARAFWKRAFRDAANSFMPYPMVDGIALRKRDVLPRIRRVYRGGWTIRQRDRPHFFDVQVLSPEKQPDKAYLVLYKSAMTQVVAVKHGISRESKRLQKRLELLARTA